MCIRISFLGLTFLPSFYDIFFCACELKSCIIDQIKCLIKKWNEYSFISHFVYLNPKEARVGDDKMINLKSQKPGHLQGVTTSTFIPKKHSCVPPRSQPLHPEVQGVQPPGLSTLYITSNYFSKLTHISKFGDLAPIPLILWTNNWRSGYYSMRGVDVLCSNMHNFF